MNWVTIEKGKWEITLDDGSKHTYRLRDKKGLRDLFESRRISEVMCSSSVDFPEDSGAPKGFNAHRVLDHGLGWVTERIAALKAKAQAVVDGTASPQDVQDVAKALIRMLEAE